MNKNTMRIAGWALGLSLAVAGIGVAVGASQGAAIETKAVDKEYELAYSFDCKTASSNGTTSKYGQKTTSMTSAYAKAFLNDAAGSSVVASVDSTPTKTYWTKGDGGPVSANDVLKIGAASSAGNLAFTLASTEIEVSKVVVTAYGWKNTSKLSVNSSAATTLTSNTTLTDYPYVLASKTRSISLSVTTSAILATRIDLYGWKQTLSADVDSPYTDDTVTLSSTAEGTVTWSKVDDGTTAEGASVNSSTGEVTVSGAGNVKVKASAAGYVDKYYTVTFAEKPAGTYYDVTFNSNGGSESPSKKVIAEGATFTFPSAGTKAHYNFAGWSSDGGTTKHAAGSTSPAVLANIAYTAYWEEHAKYSVTYSAGTNGSGDNLVTNEYIGTYTLLPFASTGLSADDGYRFKQYSVVIGEAAAVTKKPGDEISLTAATTITAEFEVSPTEFEIAYPGSTTTNMDGTNQANSVFGLNDTLWSVVGNQHEPSNNVGLNKDGTIRLYANSSGGDGNALEVSSLDDAVLVTNATFSFAGTGGGSYKVFKVINSASTEITTEDDDDSDGLTYGVNAPEFIIKNVTKSANTQVHINSINVEYDYVDSFKAAKTFENTYVKQGISYSDGSETDNCLTAYGTAITEYGKLSSDAQKWFASRDEFANARARLIQWAAVNKETLSFNSSTGALVYSAAGINGIASAGSLDSNLPLLITILATGAVAATGYFFLRKKKEN